MPHVESHKPGSFCWFELATTDQNAAKTFYTSLFGYSVFDAPMGPNEFYTMFRLEDKDAAAAYSMRKEQREQGIPPNWLIYILASDADATAKKAAEAGGNVLMQPFDVFESGRMAILQDPSGAVFAIWQPKKHIGTAITGVDGCVCWADLNTREANKASKFYSDVFGWQIAPGEGESGKNYLHIQNGDELIGGVPVQAHLPTGVPPHWMLYFLASDCEAFTAKAGALGGKVMVPPTKIENTGTFSVVTDPKGAAFALFQPAPRA